MNKVLPKTSQYSHIFVALSVSYFVFFSSSNAQEKAIFDKVSTYWGLSHPYVTAITQDALGFLWVGTPDGLNKYDGWSFEVFTHSSDDPASISGDNITALMHDSGNTLWVGTLRNGLNKYNPAAKKFTRYNHDPSDNTSLSSNVVTAIIEDGTGQVWVATDGGGLNRFNREKNSFERFAESDGLSSARVKSMAKGAKDGVLWIGTHDRGLNKFNYKDKTNAIYLNEPDDRNSANSYVRTLFLDSYNTLWIGTDAGTIFNYTEDRDTIIKIDLPKSTFEEPEDLKILSLIEDSNKNLLIGTWQNGLLSFDSENRTFKHYYHRAGDATSLSDNNVLSLFEDQTGIIMVGTEDGISQFDPMRLHFSLTGIRRKEPLSGESGFINDVVQDESGWLWVATQEGLIKINQFTSETVNVFDHQSFSEFESNTQITSLYQDGKNSLLIGTEKKGLIEYDVNQNRFRKLDYDPSKNESVENFPIKAILRGSKGRLWIGTGGNGLKQLNESTGEITSYVFDPGDEESLSSNFITSIIEDDYGSLWVGTEDGLNRFDVLNSVFHRFQHDPDDSTTIADNTIHEVYMDRFLNVWVVGASGGLQKFVENSQSFERYNDKHFFPQGEMYSILEDLQGNIWSSTKNALVRFNPITKKLTFYDRYYWLKESRFYNNASFINKEGKVFFGGDKGLLHFDPGDIRTLENIPVTYVSGITMDDSVIYSFTDGIVSSVPVLTLPYDKNRMNFTFHIIDYRYIVNNKFLYMLEGEDSDWELSENMEYIAYSDISPGEYTFKVKGANHFGIWNNAGDQITIIITPPFWLTLWFKVMTGAAVLGLIFVADKWRTRRGRIQKAILEETVERRTKELKVKQLELLRSGKDLEERVEQRTAELREKNVELNREMNVRMRTEEQLIQAKKMEAIGLLASSIAHDFNNILGVILINMDNLRLSNNLKSSKDQMTLDRISSSVFDAKDLVDKLFSFARKEKINLMPVLVNDTVRNVIKFFGKTLDENINVVVNLADDVGLVNADKVQLNQVLTNLILNARDALNNGGELHIVTKKEFVADNPNLVSGHYVRISVEDTGIGIPPETLKNIFEPFYTTKGKGTGLGLASTYNIIKEHKGDIVCESKPGHGTKMIIHLPILGDHVASVLNAKADNGQGTILIVDDSEEIRVKLKTFLDAKGYKVLEASDGFKAMEIYNDKGNEIDLLLIDMMMPGISGRDTYMSVKNTNPDVKAFLMSGYTKEDIAADLLNEGAIGFLKKPFDLKKLKKLIDEAIKN